MNKTIGLILKANKIEAKEAFKMAKKFLLDRKYKVFTKISNELPKNTEWVMVFGGDGAVLSTANKLAKLNVPLIGVNFGHRGYICDIHPGHDDLVDCLKKLLKKRFIIKPCTRIKFNIISDKKIKKSMDALNDIVVGGITRAVWLNFKIKQGKAIKHAKLVGDGIIFATKVGSTAYNLYAGGPVMLTNQFCVTISNALLDSNYFLPNTKSLVCPVDAIFEVTSQRDKKFLPYVVADGQRDYRLKKNDKVIIGRSKLITKLIELKK
jgi:NAD+ kinase